MTGHFKTWWQSFEISVRSAFATFASTNGVPRWKIWKRKSIFKNFFGAESEFDTNFQIEIIS